MLNKASLEGDVAARLRRLPEGHCLDLRTFKRNRSVCFHRRGRDVFSVVEQGFHHEEWDDLSLDDALRLLRLLLRREFPRSTKVRCYTLPSPEAADVNRMGHGAGRFGKKRQG